MTFEKRLEEVNQTLSKVSIRQRGGKLSIRGTFPPKPDDGHHPKPYEISTGKELLSNLVYEEELSSVLVQL